MGRVLVVDDEPDVLLLCRVNLGQDGHEVIEVLNGEQGIAEAIAHPPDAVVLDLMMPDVDGYEVLRTLREDKRTSALPIVVLTARTQLEDRRRCLRLGADGFIIKPFSPETLSDALGKVLALDAATRRRRREHALRLLEDQAASG